ncbi:hypothetical protein [Telluribacter humicola]|uniref:hypothetical protein n=1 Tax=Telluribacter humicola TaxID=1720261 RepID=UPI001A97672C|nr:hypothetical protein [Telluribacter humicola]
MKNIFFLILFSGWFIVPGAALDLSDSTRHPKLRGVVLKVAPMEYLINQYPTITLGTELLLASRFGVQGEFGLGYPSFMAEIGAQKKTWLYRVEARHYSRPHFSRKVRGYGAVELLQKNSNEFRMQSPFGAGVEEESFNYSLRREVYDLRAKAGLQRMGVVWVWDIFIGFGVRRIAAWNEGTGGRHVHYNGGMFAQGPGKYTNIYPALGCKVGWLLFRK